MKGLIPVAAVGRGVAAGVLGTGLMTAWQELAAKIRSASTMMTRRCPIRLS